MAVPPIVHIAQCSYDAARLRALLNESCYVRGDVSGVVSSGAVRISFGGVGSAALLRKFGVDPSDVNFSHKIKGFQIGSDDAPPAHAHREVQRLRGIAKADYYIDAVRVSARHERYTYAVRAQAKFYPPGKERVPMIRLNYRIPSISIVAAPLQPVYQLLAEVTGALGGMYALALFVQYLLRFGARQEQEKIE